MKSDYWFPWYPEIYRSDTRHLTAEQDGIYRRLLDEYMITRSPLPNNEIALARIAGITIDSWRDASAIVMAYFTVDKNGLLQQKKCNTELDEQDTRTKKMSGIGKKGAEKRWKKQRDNSASHAPAIPDVITTPLPIDTTVTETQTEIKKESNKNINKKAVFQNEIENWWVEFSARYPLKVKMGDVKVIYYGLIMEGVTHQEIMEGLEHYIKNKPDKRETLNPETFLVEKRYHDRFVPDPVLADPIKLSPEAQGKKDTLSALKLENDEMEVTKTIVMGFQTSFGLSIYTSWLKPCALLIRDKKLFIICPTRFIRDWLVGNYGKDIQRIGERFAGVIDMEIIKLDDWENKNDQKTA